MITLAEQVRISAETDASEWPAEVNCYLTVNSRRITNHWEDEISSLNHHRIHLKGPWNYDWIADVEASNTAGRASAVSAPSRSGRVNMPSPWQAIFGKLAGTGRFTRRFGCPTNLAPTDRIYLVFDGIGGEAVVYVNDHCVDAMNEEGIAKEFEITERLRTSNLLAVTIRFDPQDRPEIPGGLWAPVAIEIRPESKTDT